MYKKPEIKYFWNETKAFLWVLVYFFKNPLKVLRSIEKILWWDRNADK